MEFFDLETEFTSGKYKGKTLEEVFGKDPKFVENALLNDDAFNISDETLVLLTEINPKFTFSEEALDSREEKFDKWDNANGDEDDDYYDDDFEEFDQFDSAPPAKSKGKSKKDYDFDDDLEDLNDDFESLFSDDDDDDDYYDDDY